METSHQLMTENKSQYVHDILFNALKELEQHFPGSKLTVIVLPLDQRVKTTQNQRIFFGPLDQEGSEKPVYYASVIKPAIVSVVVAEATRQGISPNDSVVPLTLNPEVAWELYSDLVVTNNHPGSAEKGYPYLSRMILPKIDTNQLTSLLQIFHTSKDTLDIKVIEEGVRSIQDPRTRTVAEALLLEHVEYIAKINHQSEAKEEIKARKKQFYESIKNQTDDLGKVNFGELIRSALGPSSNVAISVLVEYLGELTKERGTTAQDFVQTRMNEILGAESLLTINHSSKEQKTGLWNAGRLSELMAIFSMILNNDLKLGISDEYLVLIQTAMKDEFADPVIELGQRVKRKGLFPKTQFVGKSGYFHDLDVLPGKPNSMDALMQNNGWDSTQTTKATSIIDMERLISADGKMIDVAIAIGIPHNETDNNLLQEQKIKATDIVMDKISSLLESLL